MAKEKKTDDGVLVSTAKAIGKTAGKVASLVGSAHPAAAAPKSAPVGKLPKKNKTRLPRREKKAQRKKLAA